LSPLGFCWPGRPHHSAFSLHPTYVNAENSSTNSVWRQIRSCYLLGTSLEPPFFILRCPALSFEASMSPNPTSQSRTILCQVILFTRDDYFTTTRLSVITVSSYSRTQACSSFIRICLPRGLFRFTFILPFFKQR